MQKNIWLLVGKVTEGNKVKSYIFMNNNGNTQFIQHRSLDRFYKENTVLNVQVSNGSITGRGIAISNIPRYSNQQGFGLQQIGGMSQQEIIQQCQPLIDQYRQKEQEKELKKQQDTKNEQKTKQEEYINNKLILLGNIIDIALVMKDITNEMASNGQFTRYLKQIDIDNAEGDSLTNLIQRQGVNGLANGIEDRLDRLNNRITKYNLDSSFKSKISELKNSCETLKKLHQNTKNIIKDNKEQEAQQQKEEREALKQQQTEEIEVVDELDEDAIALEDEVETVDEISEDAVEIEDEIETVDEIEEDAVAIEEETDDKEWQEYLEQSKKEHEEFEKRMEFREEFMNKRDKLHQQLYDVLNEQKTLVFRQGLLQNIMISKTNTKSGIQFTEYKGIPDIQVWFTFNEEEDDDKLTYRFDLEATIQIYGSTYKKNYRNIQTKADIEDVVSKTIHDEHINKKLKSIREARNKEENEKYKNVSEYEFGNIVNNKQNKLCRYLSNNLHSRSTLIVEDLTKNLYSVEHKDFRNMSISFMLNNDTDYIKQICNFTLEATIHFYDDNTKYKETYKNISTKEDIDDAVSRTISGSYIKEKKQLAKEQKQLAKEQKQINVENKQTNKEQEQIVKEETKINKNIESHIEEIEVGKEVVESYKELSVKEFEIKTNNKYNKIIKYISDVVYSQKTFVYDDSVGVNGVISSTASGITHYIKHKEYSPYEIRITIWPHIKRNFPNRTCAYSMVVTIRTSLLAETGDCYEGTKTYNNITTKEDVENVLHSTFNDKHILDTIATLKNGKQQVDKEQKQVNAENKKVIKEEQKHIEAEQKLQKEKLTIQDVLNELFFGSDEYKSEKSKLEGITDVYRSWDSFEFKTINILTVIYKGVNNTFKVKAEIPPIFRVSGVQYNEYKFPGDYTVKINRQNLDKAKESLHNYIDTTLNQYSAIDSEMNNFLNRFKSISKELDKARRENIDNYCADYVLVNLSCSMGYSSKHYSNLYEYIDKNNNNILSEAHGILKEGEMYCGTLYNPFGMKTTLNFFEESIKHKQEQINEKEKKQREQQGAEERKQREKEEAESEIINDIERLMRHIDSTIDLLDYQNADDGAYEEYVNLFAYKAASVIKQLGNSLAGLFDISNTEDMYMRETAIGRNPEMYVSQFNDAMEEVDSVIKSIVEIIEIMGADQLSELKSFNNSIDNILYNIDDENKILGYSSYNEEEYHQQFRAEYSTFIEGNYKEDGLINKINNLKDIVESRISEVE
jgi:hypothetical protein